MGFFEVIGIIASVITILGVAYKLAKWVVGKLKDKPGAMSRHAVTVINHVISPIERTVVVPFIVERTKRVIEKTKEAVVPIIVHPTFPKPLLPDWIRPWREPGVPPVERRPGMRPEHSPFRHPRGGGGDAPAVRPDRVVHTPGRTYEPRDPSYEIRHGGGDSHVPVIRHGGDSFGGGSRGPMGGGDRSFGFGTGVGRRED